MTKHREGFAIPLSIMVIGFLSVSLMAAFARVDSEYKVTTNRSIMVDAFGLAQSGLERFVVQRTALGFVTTPPAASESTRIALPGGYADVILTKVRDTIGGIDPVYVIRSRGTTTPPNLAGYLPARHTVAMFYAWKPGSMDVHAGWTSLGGLHKNGSSGTLSGVDNCGVNANVAGVGVPDGEWSVSGGSFTPAGTPPVDYMGTPTQMANTIDIDWTGIVAGTAITPTVNIPASGWPSFPSGYWPIIYVNQVGDFSLPGTGRGVLIVRNNLVVNGNKTWDGIVLVGGSLVSDGNNTVSGATISGLNLKLDPPEAVPDSDFGNGTKTYRYDSCAVKNALQGFGTLLPLNNTWIDNWAW
jgi:hypothetical protein